MIRVQKVRPPGVKNDEKPRWRAPDGWLADWLAYLDCADICRRSAELPRDVVMWAVDECRRINGRWRRGRRRG